MSSAATDIYRENLYEDLTWFVDQARSKRIRPISRWIEDDLILPSGPFKGERYRHRRHSASRLWFGAIESGNWNRFAASGPTQNGKTLMCYVAPVMYHLFELQETVIIGLPTMQMAQDKWTEDLLPAIEASGYRELLPLTGEGSRGGMVKRAIRFRNDVTLRFMTAGGGDKQRAGYTSRILAVTETDGMDVVGETSREADAIEQLEGRTRAYGSSKRIYLECTASIESGRIWQEITHGTDSRLYRPCPHCGEYVSPEREHLVGWQDAESELEAADKARWQCPACQALWTEDERRDASAVAVLVHRGQKVLPTGEVVGDLPPTRTLGFRWSAVDNPFATAADLGAEEWRAARSHDRENAEKKQRQFVWCLPWIPSEVELTPLTAEDVAGRTGGLRKGIAPASTVGIAVGIDTGKHELHWHVAAILQDGSAHVVEYDVYKTQAKTIGPTAGIRNALTDLHAYFQGGWLDEQGRRHQPSQVWIDSGYQEHQDAVYDFCRTVQPERGLPNAIYRPSKGYGERQWRMTSYVAPSSLNEKIRYIGKQFHFTNQRKEQIYLVRVNADFWKTDLHERFAMSPEQQGRITLFATSDPTEHDDYGEHITAERQIEKWVTGRGRTVVWDAVSRKNHYLDAAYLSLAAGQFILEAAEKQRNQPKEGWFERQQKRGGRRSA